MLTQALQAARKSTCERSGRPPNVWIVLSTYCGARFLEEQLASLRKQTSRNWKLVIRDDGSNDGTSRITASVASADPRIEVLQDDLGRLGCSGSYGRVLQHAYDADADYVFLCDQDDVWEPRKIQTQLAVAQALCENSHDTAVLICSDLQVVDANLRLIHPSFLTMASISPLPGLPLQQLLVENYVTGSTITVNRALLDFALPFPRGIWMHDWWLALCAAAIGELHVVAEPLVKYRQHDRNAIGAATVGKWLWRCLTNPRRLYRQWNEKRFGGVAQARELRDRLRIRGLSGLPQYRLIDTYCELFEATGGRLEILRQAARLGLRRRSRLRHTALWLDLLCGLPSRHVKTFR